jgi:hypothetical protein
MSTTEDKNRCTLSDKELIDKCEKLIINLCESGGRSWSLTIPPDFNKDPDMLFMELITRFKKLKNEMNEETERNILLQNIPQYSFINSRGM